MLDRVKQLVDPWLAERHEPGLDARPLICLDSTRGQVDGHCFLIFDSDGRMPRYVAKAARTPVARAVYRNDYDNLVRLEQCGMNAERPITPLPLARLDDDEVTITLQSALDGELLKNVPGDEVFSHERAARTIDATFASWHRLHECVGVKRATITPELHRNEIATPVERFRSRFVLEAADEKLLAPLLDASRFVGTELPWMVRHGDFCTANVMWGPDGVGLFDWEFPLVHAAPLFDPFYFFASTRYPFAGHRRESTHFESFEAVFWGNSYLGDVLRDTVGDACERYGIPPAVVSDLFVLSLVEVANLKVRWLEEAVGIPCDDAALLPTDDDTKQRRWATLGTHDIDAPFARLSDGIFESLRLVTRRGPPRF